MPTPMQPKPRREQLLNAAASSATGAAVIFLTNPLDCLKQRWQVAPTALTTTRANAGLLEGNARAHRVQPYQMRMSEGSDGVCV